MQPPTSQANPNPLRNNNRYEKIKDLSQGSFGFVQCAMDRGTGENVAIKFIERGDRVNRYVEAEILNHRMLRHPHVIEFREVFLTNEYVCIVMEYAAAGSLFTYVQKAGRLREAAARWFFQQLIIGLDYCHRRGVVNRDIKLENTLLQVVQGLPLPLLKICDFGYSKAHHMSAPKSRVGTLAYMAPEIINAQDKYDGKLADIWSCGVMLYIMLFGQYPFETQPKGQQKERVKHIMQRIATMQLDKSIPPGVDISPLCHDLLRRMLVPDPDQRITMANIQRHKWFTTNLPPEALTMNDDFLKDVDYTGVQSEEEIKQLVMEAQKPGPGKHNFSTIQDDDDFENMIDDAIEGEYASNQNSFNQQQYQRNHLLMPPPQLQQLKIPAHRQ